MTPIVRPLVIHEDSRGSVREAYRDSWFPDLPAVMQVTHSRSQEGTLRAMHAHKRQYDIWHFTEGRAQVQTYDHRNGDWQNLVLDNEHTIVIPPGVSHGFLALTDVTLTYYLTEEYDGSDEYGWQATDKGWPGGKRWRHKDIYKTDWQAVFGVFSYSPPEPRRVPLTEGDLIRSARDATAPSLNEFALTW